jgi:hypothetical protein
MAKRLLWVFGPAMFYFLANMAVTLAQQLPFKPGTGEGTGIETPKEFHGQVEHGSGPLEIQKFGGNDTLKDTFNEVPAANAVHQVPKQAGVTTCTMNCPGSTDPKAMKAALWAEPNPPGPVADVGFFVAKGKARKLGVITQIGTQDCPKHVFANIQVSGCQQINGTNYTILDLPRIDSKAGNDAPNWPGDRQFSFDKNPGGVMSDIPGSPAIPVGMEFPGLDVSIVDNATGKPIIIRPGDRVVTVDNFLTFISCACSEDKNDATLTVRAVVKWTTKTDVTFGIAGVNKKGQNVFTSESTKGTALIRDVEIICPETEPDKFKAAMASFAQAMTRFQTNKGNERFANYANGRAVTPTECK